MVSTGANPTADLEFEMSGLRIAAVCGSLSATSRTRSALSVVLEGAAEYDVDTTLIELRDYDFAVYGSRDEGQYSPDVERLRGELAASHGIILGTPEYHGSLSGALKNMLDFMGPAEFEVKIIGLVGVAGGHAGAINSLNTLRVIGRNLHSWVLPQEVSVAESYTAIAEDGMITDPDLDARLRNLGRQVVKFTAVQRRVRNDEFARLWTDLPTW